MDSFLAQPSGNSLIETALSLSLLLLCVLSIVGFARAAYARHYTAFAARQGARYAMVRGSTYAGTSCSTSSFACQATAADVKTYLLSHVPLGLSAKAVSVAVTWPGVAASGLACLTLNGTNSPGCDVRVSVSYNFQFSLPLLPKTVSAFQSSSTLVIAQ